MMEPARKTVRVTQAYLDIKEGENGKELAGLRFVTEDGQHLGLMSQDPETGENYPLTLIRLQ